MVMQGNFESPNHSNLKVFGLVLKTYDFKYNAPCCSCTCTVVLQSTKDGQQTLEHK